MPRLILIAAALSWCACAHRPSVSPSQELADAIAHDGTRHYKKAGGLLERARDSLVGAGYEVVTFDADEGSLLTNRKFSHFVRRTGTPVYRQYRVTVSAAPEGRATLTLKPLLFLADAPLDVEEYDLDYERKVWSSLFEPL